MAINKSHGHGQPTVVGSDSDVDKEKGQVSYSRVEDEDDKVTVKTWMVVMVLAASYGISFWPVPFFSTIQSQMALSFGSTPGMGTWLTSVYSIGGTIAFMIFGANSDLFGRRAFILFGNVLMITGSIVGGTAHSIGQAIAAHVLFGLGGGACQMAAFSLPELLPNKWRHFAVVLADAGIYFDVIVGPVAARIALKNNAVCIESISGLSCIDAISVAMGLLGYHIRSGTQLCCPPVLLLPTKTS